MNTAKKNITLSKYAQWYLAFVNVAFAIAGTICAGLYLNLFGFADRVSSYIMADTLMNSMIRSTAAATLMTLLIDLLSQRYTEE